MSNIHGIHRSHQCGIDDIYSATFQGILLLFHVSEAASQLPENDEASLLGPVLIGGNEYNSSITFDC